MNENEISRLAAAINDLRPDWPASSLRTFLHRPQLANRPYRDVAVAMAWVAVDVKLDGTPASDNPARVIEAGPWWIAATAHDGKTRTKYPPKRDQECRTHPGQYATNCAPCATDRLAYDAGEPLPVIPGASPARAREELRKAQR